jgi:hypothetical protein
MLPLEGDRTPKLLLQEKYDEADPRLEPMGSRWDIHPDGKRFLMLKPYGMVDEESTSSQPHKINVVLNFFEELKARVPVP